MAGIGRLLGGLRALVGRRRIERELDEELQAYLDASVEEKLRTGMPLEAARRAARVELGSLAAVKDHTRDVGWETTVEQCWSDLRFAARTLGRSKAFAAVVVATLTLGIGANTAIFSAVNAILLRALPVEQPGELVALRARYASGVEPFSHAAYRTIAAEGAPWVDALAASPARREAVTLDGPPETVELKWVSGGYFTTLGVPAVLGRPLVASDDPQPPGVAVAVISDAFWARRFGRDPAAVGRGLQLRGTAFTIVGVARRGFAGETPGESVDLWLPLSSQPNTPAWVWSGHSTTWLSVLARRRPGVGLVEARAGLVILYAPFAQLGTSLGEIQVRTSADASPSPATLYRALADVDRRLTIVGMTTARERVQASLATQTLVARVSSAFGLLALAIAAVGLGGLVSYMTTQRTREIGLRMALGAREHEVRRLVLSGTARLVALGAAIGLPAALLLSRLLTGLLYQVDPHDPITLALSLTMLSSAAAVAGYLPARRASRVDPVQALRVD